MSCTSLLTLQEIHQSRDEEPWPAALRDIIRCMSYFSREHVDDCCWRRLHLQLHICMLVAGKRGFKRAPASQPACTSPPCILSSNERTFLGQKGYFQMTASSGNEIGISIIRLETDRSVLWRYDSAHGTRRSPPPLSAIWSHDL